MEDIRIVELFWARSEMAIHELSEKYGNISMKTAYNILGNKEDAEECLNDSYLGVWNTLPPHRPSPLLTYLLRIVRNISISRYRYNTRQKRKTSYQECVEELEYMLDSGMNVEDLYMAKELAKYIEGFLGTLSETNKLLFVRRYWYVDSYEMLSAETGLHETVIRTRLSRTRNALKKYLEKREVFL